MKIDTPSFAFLNVTNYSDRIVPVLKDGTPLIANKTPSQKIGIKVYGCVMGWILSLFGVAACLRDAHNRIYFVNKSSLIGWATANGANHTLTWRDLELLLQHVYSRQKTSGEYGECEICYYQRKFVKLECGHAFCIPCMKDWIQKNPSPICPIEQNLLTPNDLKNIGDAKET